MWPPTISSAPESTRRASTWLRRATGFFRVRHGAPISWWCSATTRSAPGAASRSRSVDAVELRVADAARLVAPRPHRVEPDDVRAVAGVAPARSSPTARSNSRHGCVNRAGKVYGMSWFPGTASDRQAEPAQERRGRARARSRRPRWVRSPLAITSSGRDALDERCERRARAPGRLARRNGGPTRAGCA